MGEWLSTRTNPPAIAGGTDPAQWRPRLESLRARVEDEIDFAQKSERSAKGVQYESQGQVRSTSPLVTKNNWRRALKVRNINVNYPALSELRRNFGVVPGATRLTLFGACPWLSYCAPLALG
jgi:hypothetical protein